MAESAGSGLMLSGTAANVKLIVDAEEQGFLCAVAVLADIAALTLKELVDGELGAGREQSMKAGRLGLTGVRGCIC